MEEPNLINDNGKNRHSYIYGSTRGSPQLSMQNNLPAREKTVQRDLSEMETLHIVLKEGKTRSTVYLLNDPFRTFL